MATQENQEKGPAVGAHVEVSFGTPLLTVLEVHCSSSSSSHGRHGRHRLVLVHLQSRIWPFFFFFWVRWNGIERKKRGPTKKDPRCADQNNVEGLLELIEEVNYDDMKEHREGGQEENEQDKRCHDESNDEPPKEHDDDVMAMVSRKGL